MVVEFDWYEKDSLSKKIYWLENFDWFISKKQIIWVDYETFESFEYYARDKNSIYFYWVKSSNRIILNDSFENIYEDIFYKKKQKIYFKNKQNDLIKISGDWDNFKILHDYSSEYPNWEMIYVRDSKTFFSLDLEDYWKKIVLFQIQINIGDVIYLH
jgi:hypothetical protein